MAEFCLDCFNKLNHKDFSPKEVRLEDDFCEECEQWKPCVVDLKPNPFGFIRSLFSKKDK